MMESMTRFGRSIGRHPMPIPHSEDSETDEYNVIDSDRQYERIGDRGSSTGTTSSSRSSNHNGALVDPLILSQGAHHIHNAHLFNNHKSSQSASSSSHTNTMGKQHMSTVMTTTSAAAHPTHYAESAIYRRSRGNGVSGSVIGSPLDSEPPPLIPESQLFISGTNCPNQSVNSLLEQGWKSQHSTLEFGHLNHHHHHHHPQQHHLNTQSTPTQQPLSNQNTTMLSNLDSTTNTSNATTTTSVNQVNMAPVYESACLMRTASGSLYIPSDNKGAFKPSIQSINEFTIGGTLKKPDRRLPTVGANHSHFSRPLATHLSGSRFRKILSVQWNWKYTAIAFILISMALLIAITYIMSSALSVANMAQNTNCPVMVDDILELNPAAAQQPQPLQPSSINSGMGGIPIIGIGNNNNFHTRNNFHGGGHSRNPFNNPYPFGTTAEKNIASHHHVPSSISSFTNIQQLGRTYSQRVPSFGYWHLRYHQSEPSLVKFNLSLPSSISQTNNVGSNSPSVLAIYGNRDKPATHTRYDFVEFIDRVLMATSATASLVVGRQRLKRANEHHSMATMHIIQKEFTKYLDNGIWFLTLYNDAPLHVDVSLDLTLATEELCPFNCRGHGVCIAGHCKCDPGYNGESCDLMTCPVLCSGRGQYLNGECVCNSGWKGKECQIREDECEVSNCNGHGDCIDGTCHCFSGYKGDHCENVDCLDPKCSGHGHCMSGVCICGKGWKGGDCSEPDNEATHCLPDCSGHGNFDLQLQQCICDERWSGSDCSQERCDLDCGTNGHCEDGECVCDEGWSGEKCLTRLCDPRCLEHGQCQNGTCICAKGWNGRHCSLAGCVNDCNEHGECVRQHLTTPNDELLWVCVCEPGYAGLDCSVALESQCGDNIDNDKDGLVDCADPECCQSKECESKQLCFSASDPQDILLRKQPPAMTASFYQRMQFLIEEESVQSFAQKMAFNDSLLWNRINESRASVIRGQIVDSGGLGITGVRVGVSTDPFLGFTMTRENGWFDLMVNGGGSVTLHFHREPFKSVQKVVNVPINEIIVLDKIFFNLEGQTPAAVTNDADNKKSAICSDHDYDKMKPIVVATWKQPFQNSHSSDQSAILAESQIVQESIRMPGTGIHLVYHSSRSNGYLSTIELQLTPDKIESTLRLVYLKISVEGILFEKIFEADPNILYTYAWNRRNVYRQKVYGLANAVIQVGYQYNNCVNIIWEMQTVQLAGHDMPISEIGGWNIDVHHRYNFHEGILQKGDGSNVYLKKNSKLLTTSVGDGQQRPLHCSYCNGMAKDQRLLAPVALASAPDGSLYIGDFNLIRRLRTDGTISTVVELSESSVAYKYHLAVGSVDGKLYFSDPEKHQVFRVINTESPNDPRNNLEVFVGSGVKCLPGDRTACGDGRSAREAKLSYPKGIVLAPTGELYIADGTNIRMVDTFGIIHTIIGDHYHKSHWKPIPCSGSTPINKLILRWPTQLAISPLDQTLHILDDHMVLKVTNDKRIVIVAGRPSHCPSYIHHRHQTNESEDKKELSDSKEPLATQVFLETPQAITFGPNGDLYIAESDSQNTNRVRVVSVSDQRISRFAGADINCSCMDISCKCFSPDDLLAVNVHLSTISSITVTPDGKVHISDQENLRVRTVYSPLPQQNPSTGEYEIVWPETHEVFVFNRHGQHISTKSALTGTLIYSFTYNVNAINGKISSVSDAAGNKIYILRDYSNQVKSIENSQGEKCRLSMNRQGLLASFTTPSNYVIKFNYQGNLDALLTSRTDSWGKSTLYKYDEYGRVIQVILPTGDVMRLNNRLAFDGTTKLLVSYNDIDLIRLDVGDKYISKNVLQRDEVFTLERLSNVNPSTKGSSHKLAMRKRDTSHLEIESMSSPVIADSWSKMSELWPLPSIMRIIYNSENVKSIEWKYFVKRNSMSSKLSGNTGNDPIKKPSLTSIGRKLKLNGNTILSIEYDKDANQQTLFDHSNRPLLHMDFDNGNYKPTKFISNFNLTPVELEYDQFARLLSWKRGQLSLQLSYDLKGRVTGIKYGDGSSTKLKYDTSSGPTEIIKAEGNSRYLLQYDANGGLTAIMTPAGHRNELYRQVSLGFYKLLFLPSGFHNPFIFQYDEWGRTITKLLPNNSGRKVMIYNTLGLLETELSGCEKIKYIYHAGTNLIKTINKTTSDNFDYKAEYRHQGSLLKEERISFNSRTELSNYKLRYKYDGMGHINVVEFELQGRSIETKKLKYSILTGMEEGVDTFIFKRHSANVVQIGDERLLKTIATDSYGRMVGITFSVWNKELFSQVIQYEQRRSRIAQSRLKYGANYINSNYTYTSSGFLEQVLISGSSTVSNVVARLLYGYDIDGNLKTIHEGDKELKIRRDEAGRARSFSDNGEDLFMIDERGFTISRDSTNKYMWNANGQLTGVMLNDGSQNDLAITYHYDHKNRLMSRFVTSSSNTQNRTQFIYDETLPSSISHCVIDSRIIGFIYDTNGHLIALTIEGTKYYVASDHLGSPVAVYTGDGVLVKEIIRDVWGKILKDSNPSFWLPIDFHGSIRDPLTGLNHFKDGRVYDSSIAQWLTPSWDAFDKDLEDMIHLYRFQNNDPVNPAHFVKKMDGAIGSLPMSDIKSWLQTFGYRLDFIFDEQIETKDFSFTQSSPVITSLNAERKNLIAIFNHLSMIPESKIKLPFDSNSESFFDMHEISIAMMPSPLSAALISRTPRITTVHSIEIEKNPIINSVLTNVFNGTYSLPFHLVHHSKDEFFFVQPSQNDVHQQMQRDIEQLHKLGSMVNVSRVPDSDSSFSTSHLLVNTGNLMLNIRYGASFDEEINRVARLARRKTVQEACIERYPQLADDPTNVKFKRDSSNLSSRKRRNHSRRQQRSSSSSSLIH
ncbi:teneurin transmembrane protein Ten-m isoform X1 [Dermatophagoides pteronyssinus]|uniref:teneurin transmembrane protein Ten-m isoform X1 n=1 Tax=Dermatophagoides pteronyssinus TaxID=6956 RepID=UPI003F667736